MKTIRSVMVAYSIALVASMALAIGTVLLFDIRQMESSSMESITDARMTGYDDSVRYQVQNVVSLLNTLYQKQQEGLLTENEAQEQAKILVKGLRYGDDESGYFWIDDTDYFLVAHPILPQNEGTIRYTLKDQNGVYIIQEIMKVVKANPEGGFSEFYFTKADGVTVAPKRTYSILFEPWEWIISSGNYYDDINTDLANLSSSFTKQFNQSLTIVFCIFIVLCALALLVALKFSKSFSQPIIEVADQLTKMDSGDLTVQTKGNSSKTEIGRMRKLSNSFAKTIHDIISSVRTKAEDMQIVASELDTKTTTISEGVHEVAKNLEDLSHHADTQKKSARETTQTIESMHQSIKKLTDEIEQQANDVTQSSSAIEEMVANINSISTNINLCTDNFNKLADNSAQGSQSIAEVTTLVKTVAAASEELLETNKIIADVASRTNLLAMNAAIEAAHAGNAGKGFAVVADEIRKLSENTTKQSHVIGQTLDKVTEHINGVVSASGNASTIFGGIRQQISDANNLILEISSAMTEQSEGSQQIIASLSHIKDITATVRTGSHSMDTEADSVTKAMEQLSTLADDLQASTLKIKQSMSLIQETVKSVTQTAEQNRSSSKELTDQTSTFIL